MNMNMNMLVLFAHHDMRLVMYPGRGLGDKIVSGHRSPALSTLLACCIETGQ